MQRTKTTEPGTKDPGCFDAEDHQKEVLLSLPL